MGWFRRGTRACRGYRAVDLPRVDVHRLLFVNCPNAVFRVTELEKVQPKSRAEWRAWLEKNHATSPGVWFVYFKKSAGKVGPSYDDMVEEALCFGWIDSIQRGLDAQRTMLKFTPRKPKSVWSKINKGRIGRLKRLRLMTPAGMAKVDAAKRDGSWNALNEIDKMTVPPDLKAALAANPSAAKHYDAFPPSSKKIILTWIASAKRPETRAKRVSETVRQAAKNLKANHYRQ